MMTSEWTYQKKKIKELPEDCEGFVYLITNITNDRKYIGKKLAKFKKTRPPLNGIINVRVGSSKVLKEELKRLNES